MPLSRCLRTPNADIPPKQDIPQSRALPRGGCWLLDISYIYTDVKQAAAANYTQQGTFRSPRYI